MLVDGVGSLGSHTHTPPAGLMHARQKRDYVEKREEKETLPQVSPNKRE